MGDLRYLQPGGRIDGLPTRTWNRHNNATKAVEAMLGLRGAGDAPTPLGTIRAINSSGGERFAYQVVGLNGFHFTAPAPVFSGPSIDWPNNPPPESMVSSKMVAPSTNLPWGVVAQHTISGVANAGPVRYLGPAWVIVDVLDTAHQYAGPVDDEFDWLASSGSGAPLLWKSATPAATGKQWAIALLGGGGTAGGLLQYAVTSGNISAASIMGNDITPGTGNVNLVDRSAEPWVRQAGDVPIKNGYYDSVPEDVPVWLLGDVLINAGCTAFPGG